MQTLFKYVAQFLLIPLLKEFAKYLADKYKARKEAQKLKEENSKKGEAYEKAPAATADDEFSKLP